MEQAYELLSRHATPPLLAAGDNRDHPSSCPPFCPTHLHPGQPTNTSGLFLHCSHNVSAPRAAGTVTFLAMLGISCHNPPHGAKTTTNRRVHFTRQPSSDQSRRTSRTLLLHANKKKALHMSTSKRCARLSFLKYVHHRERRNINTCQAVCLPEQQKQSSTAR